MGDFCTSGHFAFKRKLLKGETSALWGSPVVTGLVDEIV